MPCCVGLALFLKFSYYSRAAARKKVCVTCVCVEREREIVSLDIFCCGAGECRESWERERETLNFKLKY